MIIEDFCSYEVSKLLKEKGFPFTAMIGALWIDEQGKTNMHGQQTPITWEREGYTPCVTQDLAMKWLREQHNIHILVNPIVDYVEDADGRKYSENVYWAFDFMNSESGKFIEIPINDYQFDTYDEAVEAALKYCLTNLIR